MRTRLALFAFLLLGFPAAAATQAAPPNPADLAMRFQGAMSYDQFLASDTARTAQWHANTRRAAQVVATNVARASAVPGRWHLLVVAENSCGDAVNSIPYLVELGAASGRFDVRLLRKADASDLLESHKYEGRAATPLVLILDENYRERAAWIERPAALRAFMAKAGQRFCEEDLNQRVRAWYQKDAGRSMSDEILTLLDSQLRTP